MKYIFLFLFPFFLSAQETTLDSINTEKSNPIIFGEFFMGLGGGSNFGGFLGTNLNYQHQNHLITFRYADFGSIENSRIRSGGVSNLLVFPAYVNVKQIKDYSLLYGNRYTNKNVSFSWSAGLGIVHQQKRSYIEELNKYGEWISNTSVGIPIELNVKWFKAEKKRFRAYFGIIPVGKKKVAFGRSFGFKLIGNVSKNSYFGLGISYGFGTHKSY
ncbi:MAG: hypothetical protein RBR78_07850 [Flavobacteriaceae bacterium]|jgi:hypothetical protein|nr:hypothetical protein [Flavobacteriaceae bacterium]